MSIDLEPIKRRCEAATPGPWRDGCGPNGKPIVFACISGYEAPEALPPREWVANLAFADNARDDVPALIAEIERLRSEAVNHEAAVATLADRNRECNKMEDEIERLRQENAKWLEFQVQLNAANGRKKSE